MHATEADKAQPTKQMPRETIPTHNDAVLRGGNYKVGLEPHKTPIRMIGGRLQRIDPRLPGLKPVQMNKQRAR